MEKLAAQMPDTPRPMNSSHSTGVIAITIKSMPSPKLEIRITVRRPKRSDSVPCTGEKMNCISMYSVAKPLVHTAACAMLPPISCTTRCGSTGMMMPNASMSSITVTKMKANAALVREVEGIGAESMRGARRGHGKEPTIAEGARLGMGWKCA